MIVGAESSLEHAASVLATLSGQAAHTDALARQVSVPVASHGGILTRAVRELDAAGVELDDIGFRRATLDEVFLGLTGKPASAETSVSEDLAS